MMKPKMTTVTMPAEICQFCYTNGESREMCGHRLKSPTGLVACPVLRAFVCPLVSCLTFQHNNHFCAVTLLCFAQCGATGDEAHTVSYCPTNRDGRFSEQKGASISVLKKKKNAAGRYGRSSWLRPAPVKTVQTDHLVASMTPPGHLVASMTPPGHLVASMTPDYNLMFLQQNMFWEPDCVQRSLYHHYQWAQYYR